MSQHDPLIVVKNLSLVKRRQILSSVSFDLMPGEVVCLAGRNGAGKTSFLKCLAGLMSGYTGQIIRANDAAPDNSAQSMGVLIGKPPVYTHLNAYENLDIIRRYHHLPRTVIAETLNALQLAHDARVKTKYFSTGMLQRLAMGMSMLHRPPAMLLDEPFTALDPESLVVIRDLLRQLNDQHRVSLILSTHDLGEVSKLFTRLVIMKAGEIIFDVSRAALEQFVVVTGTYQKGERDDLIYAHADRLQLRLHMANGLLHVMGTQEAIASFASETHSVFLPTLTDPLSLEEIYIRINTLAWRHPAAGL